jgi:multidrug efflux pump subunit AcrB
MEGIDMTRLEAARRRSLRLGACAAVVLVLSGLAPGPGPACPGGTAAEAAGPPKEVPPDVGEPPAVQVLTFHPGMQTSVIEATITNRLERRLGQAEGVRLIESHTVTGVSVIRIYFHRDVEPGLALAQIGALAQGASPTLPQGTSPPLVLPICAGGSQPIGMVVCRNQSLDGGRLKDLAQGDVRLRLAALEGCAVPAVLGGRDRAVTVRLDPQRLDAYGIRRSEVIEALHKGILMPASGTVVLGDNQATVAVSSGVDRIERLNHIPLRTGAAQPVFLRDVGRVEETLAERTARIRINGRPAVCLPVLARPSSAPDALRRRVAEALPRIERRLPAGTSLSFVPFGDEGKSGRPGDTGLLTISLRGPSAMTLDASERLVVEVERFLESTIPAEERLAMVSELGLGADSWAAVSRNDGPQDSTIRVQLTPKRSLTAGEYAGKVRRLFEEKFAGLRACFDADGTEPPIDIRIEGQNLEAAELAAAVRQLVARVRGTVDVEVVQRLDALVLHIDVDRERAAAMDLSAQEVIEQALSALGPGVRGGLQKVDLQTGETYPVIVKYAQGQAVTLDDVLHTTVSGPKQERIPLGTLINIRQQVGPVAIDHIGLRRVVNVRAGIADRDPGEVVAEVKEALKGQPVSDGMHIELGVRNTSPVR